MVKKSKTRHGVKKYYWNIVLGLGLLVMILLSGVVYLRGQNDQLLSRRIELSSEEWNKIIRDEFKKGTSSEGFFDSRFESAPNTFITYTSDKYGYSIKLPYNKDWGDSQYGLKPYELKNLGLGVNIFFGKPLIYEGGGIYRMSISELPPLTVIETKRQLDSENLKIKNNPNEPQIFYVYSEISGYKYPVLKVDVPSEFFGEIPSYRVFLPTTTLIISDVSVLDEKSLSQIINSIKVY